jgi:hypothetical protein
MAGTRLGGVDINTATWVAGVSGGVLGASGTYAVALRQRAWDREAAAQLRHEQDRSARFDRVSRAVARLFAAVTELQLSLVMAAADQTLGFYGRHAAYATNRLPDIAARIIEAATEIELTADEHDLITASRAVLDCYIDLDRTMNKSGRRLTYNEQAVDALNQAAVGLRDRTRAAAQLAAYETTSDGHDLDAL